MHREEQFFVTLQQCKNSANVARTQVKRERRATEKQTKQQMQGWAK